MSGKRRGTSHVLCGRHWKIYCALLVSTRALSETLECNFRGRNDVANFTVGRTLAYGNVRSRPVGKSIVRRTARREDSHARNEHVLLVSQGKRDYCTWMTPHPVHDWIYQGPAITVLVMNLVFLSKIMWVSGCRG